MDDIGKLKELYDYSVLMLQNTINRQQHQDTRSLYLLQATAVLATLFLGLIGVRTTSVVASLLTIIIYISLFFTFIFLLCSLGGDSIALFGGKNNQRSTTLLPKTILESNEFKDKDINKYYENLIIDFTKEIDELEGLIKSKKDAYIRGLISFIIAVTLIILLGFKNI